MTIRKLSLSILATLCTLTGVLALGDAQASAYLKHEYVSQITGTPEGPDNVVCGLAIGQASQDLYVADFHQNFVDGSGSAAIEIFEPSGSGGYIYKSHFDAPKGLFAYGEERCPIAVSDVTGDIYVVSGAQSTIRIFNSVGGYLGELNGSTTPNGFFNGYVKVAVDQSSGDVYILNGAYNVVDRFNKANEYQSQLSVPGLAGFDDGLAIDSHGVLYVGDGGEHQVQEYNSSGIKIGEFADADPRNIAVDPGGNVYVAGSGFVDEFNSSGVFEGRTNGTPSEHFENVAGIAVNAASDPYVIDKNENAVDVFGPAILVPGVSTEALSKLTSTTSTLNGTVNPDGTQVTSCEFEYGLTSTYGQTAACEPTPVGSSPVAVSANLKGLQPGTEYHYRLVVRNPNGFNESEDATFFTPGPQVEGESFSEVGLHRATVNAQINPEGLPTTYTIEYGMSKAYGSTTPATSVGAGTVFVNVTSILGASIEGVLQSGTTYHFRVVATNADGTRYGADVIFATLSGLTGLPDGRGYELVSPLANVDGDVYPPESEKGFDELVALSPTRASADGNAVEYVADRLAAGGSSSGNTFVAAHNSGGGWSSPVDLSTPGFDGVPFEALFANELSNNGTGLVPAGSHVLSSSGKGLFDSVGGRLSPISVLPEGDVVTAATFGSRFEERETLQSASNIYQDTDISHVVSADGSRVFWTDLEEGSDMEHLFVRENDSTTVSVSVGAAQFRAASPDGRYVFYTEQQRLLRFDVENGSREELAGAGAGVLGVVGINETGEDGAYVYFVANGVLGDGAGHGAHQGTCTVASYLHNGSEANCNLYVDHDGVTGFIAALLPDDISTLRRYYASSAPAGVVVGSLVGRTAEVSVNGQAVVFESSASLTGYENDGHRDAFVYNARSGELSCVSCNPTGVPATGPDTPVLRGSDSELWTHRWISEDGARVFFESREGLVAQDTNGVRDVYEWEQDGTGSCEDVKGCVYLLSGGTSSDNSYFLDASVSGNDVFMISRADLVPQDQGDTYEVYDARVGAKEPVGEPVCTGTGCQGLPAGPPLFATPSSVTFAGVGNFSPGIAPAAKTKAKGKVVGCRKGTHKHNGKCVRSKAAKAKARKSIHGKGSK
jgi:hypothetical protein